MPADDLATGCQVISRHDIDVGSIYLYGASQCKELTSIADMFINIYVYSEYLKISQVINIH